MPPSPLSFELSHVETDMWHNLCTVFAESEVVSLIARGEQPSAIALALHDAIATRIATMAGRAGVTDKVVFAGGGALNTCLRTLLARKLGKDLTVPDAPQMVGALGAVLIARQEGMKEPDAED